MADVTIKPIFATFPELMTTFTLLHQGDLNLVSELHDIWKLGAPSPDSIIRNPRDYDERKRQPGNYEARLIFPTSLMKWVKDAAARRGMQLSDAQVAALLQGEVRYTP